MTQEKSSIEFNIPQLRSIIDLVVLSSLVVDHPSEKNVLKLKQLLKEQEENLIRVTEKISDAITALSQSATS